MERCLREPYSSHYTGTATLGYPRVRGTETTWRENIHSRFLATSCIEKKRVGEEGEVICCHGNSPNDVSIHFLSHSYCFSFLPTHSPNSHHIFTILPSPCFSFRHFGRDGGMRDEAFSLLLFLFVIFCCSECASHCQRKFTFSYFNILFLIFWKKRKTKSDSVKKSKRK